ncbi:hypothetical protein GCM10010345_94380 [Streptomyces canarius]|uniref:Uncharacterized protein n=1 Tax=Streptomyces canarius TaxID=285453 RepID=A0ABQ3DC56_9ACTN|nr:hypothetical protein GCM10010345_94380 [Streptomyces canarius]
MGSPADSRTRNGTGASGPVRKALGQQLITDLEKLSADARRSVCGMSPGTLSRSPPQRSPGTSLATSSAR